MMKRQTTCTFLLIVLTLSTVAYGIPAMCSWTPQDCQNSTTYEDKAYSIHCFVNAHNVRLHCESFCGQPPYSMACFYPPDRGYCSGWVLRCASRSTTIPHTEVVPLVSTPDVSQNISENEPTPSNLTTLPTLDLLTGEEGMESNSIVQTHDSTTKLSIFLCSNKWQGVWIGIITAAFILLAIIIAWLLVKTYCNIHIGSGLPLRWQQMGANDGVNKDIERGGQSQEMVSLLLRIQGATADRNEASDVRRDSNGVGTSDEDSQIQYPSPNPQVSLQSTISERRVELEDRLRPFLKDDSDSIEVQRICAEYLLGMKKPVRHILPLTSDSSTLAEENTRVAGRISVY